MKNIKGLSLIELLSALGIASIILGVGLPGAKSLVAKSRSESATANVIRAIQMAREYAVSNNYPVLICGSDSGEKCSKRWSRHLIVFIDKNRDNDLSHGDKIVFSQQVLSKQGYMKSRIATGRNYTAFNYLGNAKFVGSFIYCPDNNDARYAARVTWNKLGRPYKGEDFNQDGFIDDTSRSKIQCD